MRIYLSSSDYLRNFNRFIDGLDFSEPEKLEIKTHPNWINVHPAVLTLAAALALEVEKDNVSFPELTAVSGSYLDRMGLFNFTSQKSPYEINEKDPSGRFVPISIIKTPSEQSKFMIL